MACSQYYNRVPLAISAMPISLPNAAPLVYWAMGWGFLPSRLLRAPGGIPVDDPTLLVRLLSFCCCRRLLAFSTIWLISSSVCELCWTLSTSTGSLVPCSLQYHDPNQTGQHLTIKKLTEEIYTDRRQNPALLPFSNFISAECSLFHVLYSMICIPLDGPGLVRVTSPWQHLA